MNIQKILEDKKNNLQQLVNTYQILQQKLNELNTQILETNGQIKQLQELLDLEKKEIEDNKNKEVKKEEIKK